ncbi:MAG: GNAT family N-acetyltransferase [Candidatus Pacebacteria bacterium]|nr:GNAT family N-acetyltransferase [Candidatus Paceibacterota bacterium]
MKIKKKVIEGKGLRFSVVIDGKEMGRAFLYILYNDLHEEPFGFLEDVYIEENLRGQGVGTQLLDKVMNEAKKKGCYKIIATSRHSRERVHKLYERIGFKNYGIEFRLHFHNS